MGLFDNILYDSIYHSTPILLCVLGGVFAYKANVLNIALEGFMLSAAFMVMLIAYLTGNLVLGYIAAFVSSAVLGLVFSYMGITRRGNVIVIGLAINILVPAVAGFIMQGMSMANIRLTWFNVTDIKISIPLVRDIPILGSMLSGHPLTTYISFAGIFLMVVLMYHTKLGVYIRVTGENEKAATSLGLQVNRYRYIGVLIGAFFCTLAGTNLSLERMALFTNNMTAGRGFIAIAAIYCGRGDPLASSAYAFVFGITRALAVNMGIFVGPAAVLFDIIPYVIMTIVLTIVSLVKNRNSKIREIR
ncbi:MAG: ABC transporter permease [Spirochaetaceae bacterium]|nr:ABC transporter permease [Spirochaetaceae bacterium]